VLTLVETGRFRKDYKLIKKRGYDLALLQSVLDDLCSGKQLAGKHRDHALTGDYVGFRECHILPDWLLIYAIDGEKLILVASRTGTHADLFGK